MSDIAEGLGAAIEGALTAKAVEPGAGSAAEGSGDHTGCANCGATLTGPYCNQCGQKAHVHRTLAAIGHDLMHGVLHLDGKLAHTLPLLTFKPGTLTRRYIEGERAKFVSPMAMFLFSVFAMFAVFQILGIGVPSSLDPGGGIVGVERSMQEAVERNKAALAKVEADLAKLEPGADTAKRAELERHKADLEAELAQLAQIAALPLVSGDAPRESEGSAGTDGGSVTLGEFDNGEITFDGTGIEWIDKGLVKKWSKNPGLMLYKLQANAYKFSWLLIPLSIPFVWLLFAWRRGFKAYDHAVFVTYSLAFTSLLFIVISVLFSFESMAPLAGLLLVFVPPVHLYKHLRGTYGLGRLGAFWRLLALSAFIWIVIGLFLQTLVLLGAF
ncbi:MAG: DUF3667 domain-containing protein [Erythrobacter sp.]|jgi:hypothetical protein|nr:DUF3667 domain-containing protein [Erythrobacter sp.]